MMEDYEFIREKYQVFLSSKPHLTVLDVVRVEQPETPKKHIINSKEVKKHGKRKFKFIR